MNKLKSLFVAITLPTVGDFFAQIRNLQVGDLTSGIPSANLDEFNTPDAFLSNLSSLEAEVNTITQKSVQRITFRPYAFGIEVTVFLRLSKRPLRTFYDRNSAHI